MDKRITEHFMLREFFTRDPKIITPIQWMMLNNLCGNILEVIRAFLRKKLNQPVTMKVTNGVRLPSDNNALRKKGYNPSETTDHLFGNIVKLHANSKIKKYGKYYFYSVGAGDVVPSCGAHEAFYLMEPYFDRKAGIIRLPEFPEVKIGQMILEKRTSYWLHISNPPELIYSDEMIAQFLNRSHFLVSENNGHQYRQA